MMKTSNDKKQNCSVHTKRIGLFGSIKMRMLDRLKDHVAGCSKCQGRLAMINRVEMALMLMKSQPYKMGLLSRANTQILNNLSHSLRHDSKSDSLKVARSEINRAERMYPVFEYILNTAACLFVVVMIKSGVSSSLLDYRSQGQTAIENYYAHNLDSQMFEEIFPSDSSSTS